MLGGTGWCHARGTFRRGLPHLLSPMAGLSFNRDSWWRRFLRRWEAHRHTDNAAALAFYALVSLVPILLAGVSMAGMVLGERAAHGELEKQLTAVVGPEAAVFLEKVLQSSRLAEGRDPLAFVVALVAMFYAGSHVLSKLRAALNLVNEAEPADPARPVLTRLLARGLCALLLLVFGVLLVVGTVVDGFIGSFAHRIDTPFISHLQLLKGYEILSTYLLLTVMFALILKILPRRRPGWRHAFAGGLLSALVVGSLKGGLDLYLRHSPLASIFGTGLTVLVFLFWLFLSIQAFLAGAETAAMLGRARDGRR